MLLNVNVFVKNIAIKRCNVLGDLRVKSIYTNKRRQPPYNHTLIPQQILKPYVHMRLFGLNTFQFIPQVNRIAVRMIGLDSV